MKDFESVDGYKRRLVSLRLLIYLTAPQWQDPDCQILGIPCSVTFSFVDMISGVGELFAILDE